MTDLYNEAARNLSDDDQVGTCPPRGRAAAAGRVPGGAGHLATGLLTGLRRRPPRVDRVPPVALSRAGSPSQKVASPPRGRQPRDRRSDRRGDPIACSDLPLIESRLPGPLMTRAWAAGMLRAPRGFAVVHAASLAVPRATGARTVVTVHDLAWRHVPFAYPKHGREWHERAFRQALSRGSDFVVPSAPIATRFERPEQTLPV